MEQDYSARLITHHNPKSPVAEAYRILRTNLNFSTLDNPLDTLLVTSSGPEEGKSTTLVNLAVAMAQAGKSVLIVDCDLRKPVQHKIFGVMNNIGITNLMISKDTKLEDAIKDTDIPNVKVMTSGPLPPNPSEMLGSKRMGELLNTLKEKFDMVLIDSPPVVAVADAPILASRVDGVLLVLRSHKTRNDMALECKSLLEKANANIVGAVVNGLPIKGDDYYYYYYYGQGNTKKSSTSQSWLKIWNKIRG